MELGGYTAYHAVPFLGKEGAEAGAARLTKLGYTTWLAQEEREEGYWDVIVMPGKKKEKKL